MSTLKILVPYNFTGNDDKAIDFVIDSFGRSADAEITLFHTYAPLPKLDISDKTVMARISANLTYLQQKTNELEEELGKAVDRLVDAGFDKERVHSVFNAAAAVVSRMGAEPPWAFKPLLCKRSPLLSTEMVKRSLTPRMKIDGTSPAGGDLR